MKECVITSSVLIAALIALRYAFHAKISRRLQYALWGLALLRLLLPFPLASSPVSVMNVFDLVPPAAAQGAEAAASAPASAGAAPVYTGNGEAVPSGEIVPSDGATPQSAPRRVDAGRLLSLLWLSGSLAFGLWLLFVNLRFALGLRRTRRPFAADAPVRVYVSPRTASPCLFGLLRPAIYLTPEAAQNDAAVPYVLAHELCHFRHLDHVWSVLRALCLAVYWWNPLVWAAAELSRRDSELACDESVTRRLPLSERLSYGHTLIGMLPKKRSDLACVSTAMNSGKRGMKERLVLLVRSPKTAVPALAAVVLIAALCACGTFTGARAQGGGVSDYAQTLFERRNPYIGDASADGALVAATGLSDALGPYTMALSTDAEPYELRLVFTRETDDADAFDSAMREHAAVLLSLIDNASQIAWEYPWQSPDGAQTCTGLLDAAGASDLLLLNGQSAYADVKQFGRSAEGVQALLDRLERAQDPGFPEVDPTFSSDAGEPEDIGRDAAAAYYSRFTGDGVPRYWRLAEFHVLSSTLLEGDGSAFTVSVTASLTAGGLGFLTGDGTPADPGDPTLGGVCPQVTRQFTVRSLGDGRYEIEGVGTGGNAASGTAAGVTYGLMELRDGEVIRAVSPLNGSGAALAESVVMEYFLKSSLLPGTDIRTLSECVQVRATYTDGTVGAYYAYPLEDGTAMIQSGEDGFANRLRDGLYERLRVLLGAASSGSPTPEMMDALLSAICASPATASNPGAYIDAHPAEYEMLLSYGDETLRYAYREFLDGGQTDLRGHILLAAMRALLGNEDVEFADSPTAQDWFDQWKAHAATLLSQNSADYVRENYPKTYILLTMPEFTE